jgi:hypothetical protein
LVVRAVLAACTDLAELKPPAASRHAMAAKLQRLMAIPPASNPADQS